VELDVQCSADSSAVKRCLAVASMFLLTVPGAFAHGVDEGTRGFLSQLDGLEVGPLLYIGAKHMVTGYDHLLFLFGVVFLLRNLRDVLIYVTLFTLGHSLTLILGVLLDTSANAYLVDALIGLSVVYKGFDNLRGFEACFGRRPNPLVMVFGFGLIHGLGLATKLQEFGLPPEHLLGNLLAFNVGVELGQVLALSLVLLILAMTPRAQRSGAMVVNTALIAAGTTLMIFQLTGFFVEGRA
jgi:hypothetical protein